MRTISMVTPISMSKISNLDFTEYVLLYLDENKKLKRAIPDFEEKFMDSSDSLINEAINSDRLAPFMVVNNNFKEQTSPIFCIYTNTSGEVMNVNNYGDNITKIENFLLDSKRRQTVSKLLKKTI